MNRCTFDHNGLGARCCVETNAPDGAHPGEPHRFKCAGPSCPGLPWPASVMPHPYTCALQPAAPPSPDPDVSTAQGVLVDAIAEGLPRGLAELAVRGPAR